MRGLFVVARVCVRMEKLMFLDFKLDNNSGQGSHKRVVCHAYGYAPHEVERGMQQASVTQDSRWEDSSHVPAARQVQGNIFITGRHGGKGDICFPHACPADRPQFTSGERGQEATHTPPTLTNPKQTLR